MTELFDGAFLARLERLRLMVRRVMAERDQADRRSRRTGSSLEFADYRTYVPGDDPRRVDWSGYGRLDKLMIKLTEDESSLDVNLLVDCSGSMRWRAEGARHRSKFDLARLAAAALAYLGLHGLDRVGVWFFDAVPRGETGYLRGGRSLHSVLRFLESAPSEGGGSDLRQALAKFARIQQRRGKVVILSDFLDPNGPLPALSELAGRHFEFHLVQIVDPAERDPSFLGDVDMEDIESGGRMAMTVSRGAVERYRREFQGFCDELKQWAHRHGGGYTMLRADDAMDDVLFRSLREARLVG